MIDVSLKVYVAQSNMGNDVDIAITFRGDVTTVAKVVEGGGLEFVPVEPRARWIPTLTLDRDMAADLLAGLLKLNLPIPSAGAIEGELKATKIHLEDLRQLLKITKRPA